MRSVSLRKRTFQKGRKFHQSDKTMFNQAYLTHILAGDSLHSQKFINFSFLGLDPRWKIKIKTFDWMLLQQNTICGQYSNIGKKIKDTFGFTIELSPKIILISNSFCFMLNVSLFCIKVSCISLLCNPNEIN